MQAEKTETATLGGGCFWCVEAIYDELKGVKEVVSGGAGGPEKNETDEDVASGTSGHAEVVQITFDPDVISFEELLEVFFAIHNPTTFNGEEPLYRSIILHHSEEQKAVAEQMIQQLDRAKVWEGPIVTEIKPYTVFYPADDHYQKYFKRNPEAPYCQIETAPKLAKFREQFPGKLKEPVRVTEVTKQS